MEHIVARPPIGRHYSTWVSTRRDRSRDRMDYKDRTESTCFRLKFSKIKFLEKYYTLFLLQIFTVQFGSYSERNRKLNEI